MSRFCRVSFLVPLILIVIAGIALGRTYAFYHDDVADRATALVMTNVDEPEAEVQVRVYDSFGTLLGETSLTLSGYASTVLFLDEFVVEAGSETWGLVLVETVSHVALSAWLGTPDGWFSVENNASPLIPPEEYDYTYYWYTINYANTPNRTTGIGIVNPHGGPVAGVLCFYDSLGELQKGMDFSLAPFASAYYSTDSTVSIDDSMWGMVDVRVEATVLLVAEYFDADDALIDVDLVASFYLLSD